MNQSFPLESSYSSVLNIINMMSTSDSTGNHISFNSSSSAIKKWTISSKELSDRTNQLQLIGCLNGSGGRELGAERAAIVIAESEFLRSSKLSYRWTDFICEIPSGRQRDAIPGIIEVCSKLADTTRRYKLHDNMAVITGDHSAAIGTWSGISTALAEHGPIGLIYMDAHLDSHTPESSHSGNVHGMPVAHLLGYGDKRLAHILTSAPKLLPSNVVFIGSRCYEEAETALLNKNSVKIFNQKSVDREGIEQILLKAVEIASRSTIGFGLSIDIDVFRVEDSPATGTPESGGVVAAEFIRTVSKMDLGKLLATEIVEFLPRLDRERRTEKLVVDILEVLYSRKCPRKT